MGAAFTQSTDVLPGIFWDFGDKVRSLGVGLARVTENALAGRPSQQ